MTPIVEQLFQRPQYGISAAEKSRLLLQELNDLTRFHVDSCVPYRNIISALFEHTGLNAKSLDDVPAIPVRLFKSLELRSIPDSEILKTLTSSGTSSQAVSRIAIDSSTSLLQTQALASIMRTFLGNHRMPMVILDTADILSNRESLSARGAGIVGLSNFGRDHFYALRSDMQLDLDGLLRFVEKYQGQRLLLFGFTFMIWEHFYKALRKAGAVLDLSGSVLIHSGGWKKLQDLAVTNNDFKAALQERCGKIQIHNFYGMVEQVGSIFMECDAGFFHAPNFSDVIVRDLHSWKRMKDGQEGVLQSLSVLPRSYPGHSILTEDMGVVYGVDDCPCGRKGTRFAIQGRIPKAELRGCSDTYAVTVR